MLNDESRKDYLTKTQMRLIKYRFLYYNPALSFMNIQNIHELRFHERSFRKLIRLFMNEFESRVVCLKKTRIIFLNKILKFSLKSMPKCPTILFDYTVRKSQRKLG